MDRRVVPQGCKDCVHAWVDRCGLSGHKQPWAVNAPYHCKDFRIEERASAKDVQRHASHGPQG